MGYSLVPLIATKERWNGLLEAKVRSASLILCHRSTRPELRLPLGRMPLDYEAFEPVA